MAFSSDLYRRVTISRITGLNHSGGYCTALFRGECVSFLMNSLVLLLWLPMSEQRLWFLIGCLGCLWKAWLLSWLLACGKYHLSRAAPTTAITSIRQSEREERKLACQMSITIFLQSDSESKCHHFCCSLFIKTQPRLFFKGKDYFTV